MRKLAGVLIALLLALLAGCSLFSPSPPAQTEQTNLELLIRAASGLNPDDQGRAAPILLRVYELRAYNVFQEADFFSLYNNDRATLGTDVLAVDQLILRPGEAYSLRRKTHPETKVIGVLAGYRDLPRATWRAIYLVPQAPEASWYRSMLPNQSASLQIDLQPSAVLITDRKLGKPVDPPPNAPLPTTAPQGNTPTVNSLSPGSSLTRIAPPTDGAASNAVATPSLLDRAQGLGKGAADAGKAAGQITESLPSASTLDSLPKPTEGLGKLLGR